MKAKEIAVLETVNVQGLDNSQWGVITNKHGLSLNAIFPVTGEMVDAPEQFLWVWLSEQAQKDFTTQIPIKYFPDSILATEDNQILMVWNIAEF